MKILPTLAGLILAGTFTSVAQADSSKEAAMSQCKAEIKASIDDISRIRTSRLREKSTGTHITFRVSTEGNDTQIGKCIHVGGLASLKNANGELIAAKTAVVSTGS